jgi:hypothetical protein
MNTFKVLRWIGLIALALLGYFFVATTVATAECGLDPCLVVEEPVVYFF